MKKVYIVTVRTTNSENAVVLVAKTTERKLEKTKKEITNTNIIYYTKCLADALAVADEWTETLAERNNRI